LLKTEKNEDINIKRIRKEKLTNTLLQKIFNERRRKYRDLVSSRDKKKNKKKAMFGRK
jgi:hypothetical protein